MFNLISYVHSLLKCNRFLFILLFGYRAFYVMTLMKTINNGNKNEWSSIRSVIIRVINKSEDREAGLRFVYHRYDYRQNWTTQSPVNNHNRYNSLKQQIHFGQISTVKTIPKVKHSSILEIPQFFFL